MVITQMQLLELKEFWFIIDCEHPCGHLTIPPARI